VGGAFCPDWKSRDLEVAPTKEKAVWICPSGWSREETPIKRQMAEFLGAQPNRTNRRFYLKLHLTYDTIFALGMEGIAIIIKVKF
jgi:hypothetical protein